MDKGEMDEENSASLHLPGLEIKGFRGFDHLTIPRLGRVTLLAGRNGAGKTSVLDAVRIFAARGRPSTLADLLQEREELTTALDKNQGPLTVPDVTALFHGRGEAPNNGIAIGPGRDQDALRLARSPRNEWTDKQKRLNMNVEALKVEYADWKDFVPWSLAGDTPSMSSPFLPLLSGRERFDETGWPERVKCEALGPGLPRNSHLAVLWHSIHLTDDEDLLVQVIGRHLGEEIQRIGVVNDPGGSAGSLSKNGVMVKLKGHSRPVPLRSFGDGAVRLFGVALELTCCRGGLLLLDEAENGLHYTVHADFWRMVLQAARDGDVQVLATTHSLDCVGGFARAATECADTDGVLVRLETGAERCRAVVYSEDELLIATEQGIEVR